MNLTFFFSFDLRWFFRTKSLFIFRSRQSENISFVIRSIQKSRKMSKNQMIRTFKEFDIFDHSFFDSAIGHVKYRNTFRLVNRSMAKLKNIFTDLWFSVVRYWFLNPTGFTIFSNLIISLNLIFLSWGFSHFS